MHPSQQGKRRAGPRKRKHNLAGYSDERETAEALNRAIRTLRKWRQLQIGPPWTKVGRQVLYNDESRAAWLRRHEVQPTRETV